MKCPYCNIGIRLEITLQQTFQFIHPSTTETGYELIHGLCPECKYPVVLMKYGQYKWVDGEGEISNVHREEIVFPKDNKRSIDPSVPSKYREAYNEANSVLFLSAKASAALSRRLLQCILWDEYKIKGRNLDLEIAEFTKLPGVPKEISGAVDAIRHIGNFAAHPNKYTNTGEIVDVEPGEADWSLDVLEALFDYTFIQPSKEKDRKDKLDHKLQALGKPQMRK